MQVDDDDDDDTTLVGSPWDWYIYIYTYIYPHEWLFLAGKMYRIKIYHTHGSTSNLSFAEAHGDSVVVCSG